MSCTGSSNVNQVSTDSLYVQSLKELRHNLQVLSGWEKVHAAEYLLWLGYEDSVRQQFLREEEEHANESPYRIGIWRVLAQSFTGREREHYINLIRAAYRDEDGPDRLHAAETLAKLGIPLLASERAATEEILKGEKNRLYVYTLWGASLGSARYQSEFKQQFIDFAVSDTVDSILRLQSAFALRNLKGINAEEWSMLARSALAEDAASIAQIYLLSAAYFNIPPDSLNTDLARSIRQELLDAADAPQKGARMEMAYVLGELGEWQDLELLSHLLNNRNPLNNGKLGENTAIVGSSENADVRSSAAFGILRIGQRLDHGTLVKSTK